MDIRSKELGYAVKVKILRKISYNVGALIKMLNLGDIVRNKNESSLERNDWPFRMLIIGPSGSGKTNTLLHLINNFHPIDKIYLYAKDTDEQKYQYLINKRQ